MRSVRVVVLALLAPVLAAPAAHAASAVTSGPLTVSVGASGRITVTQRGGAGLNGRLGAGVAATVRRGGPGVVELLARGPAGAASTTASFAFAAGERTYGFGERSNAVQQRGRQVEDYVSDGPVTKAAEPIVGGTIPPWGYRPRPDATYYPVPWLLSSRGYGVLDRDDVTSRFDLRGPRWSVTSDGARLHLAFYAGPSPAAALARFTRDTGRQPAPAAPWAYGPWFQTGQPSKVPLRDEAAFLAELRRARAPVSAAETQMRYLPCGLDRGNAAYERRRVAFFHRHGLAILTYLNPMLCRSYGSLFATAKAAGALQEDASGQPFTFPGFVGGVGAAGFTITPLAQFDWTAPATAGLFRTFLTRANGPLGAGHDGWMEDFGEYTSPAVRSADGTPGAAMHNRYPRTYHCAIARIVGRRPVVRFQRSGWTGAARCASDVWGGDPATAFGFDGLTSAVREALSMGLSGVARWGSDIGGYDTYPSDPRLTPELLERWIEFGAVSGVMRTKLSGLAFPSYARPQVFDPGIVPVWRAYAGLHTRLYPYISAADAAYRATGLPLMRSLLLIDPRGAGREDEFGFGPDLLAAPVVTRGARARRVYLPRGTWIPWGGTRRLRGGRTIRAAAPLATLPLYVRAGALIPLLPADVMTLASYGRGVVHLKDRRGALTLLAFPGPSRSAGMFGGRERIRSTVARARWTLRITGARTRRYTLRAATAGLRFRPCRATLGGHRVALRLRRGRLAAAFRTRRGTLVVRACR